MADVHVTTYINLCCFIVENFVSISIGTDTYVATDVSCQADILMAPSIRRLYETERLGGGGEAYHT